MVKENNERGKAGDSGFCVVSGRRHVTDRGRVSAVTREPFI